MSPSDDLHPGLPGGRLASSRSTSRSPQESSLEQAWERFSGAGETSGISRPGIRSDTKGLGWLVLVPVACCGGPLIFAAIATAGAAAWGGIGALATITLGIAVVVVMRRRRTASCCPSTEASKGTRRATNGADRS